MTSKAHALAAHKTALVLLFLGFGALFYGCRSQQAQIAPAKEALKEAAKETKDSPKKPALRESDPPELGKRWRTGLYDKRIIGYRSKDSGYHISHTFGIEQWEDGKRTTHRFQRWWIRCDYPGYYQRNRTECSLERPVIDDMTIAQGGGSIGQYSHSRQEGNLTLRDADWESGRIDFAFIYDDQSTEEVSIRFSLVDTSLVFESFKSVGIGRSVFSGEPHSSESRIAEYTYVLNVPVLMEGMYDAGLKAWDQLFATLSPTDQAAWNELIKSPQFKDYKFPNNEFESRLKSALPNLDVDAYSKGKRELSKEEQQIANQVLDTTILKGYLELISGSRLSADAKRKIGDYIAANL
jgi:hypothetical protein